MHLFAQTLKLVLVTPRFIWVSLLSLAAAACTPSVTQAAPTALAITSRAASATPSASPSLTARTTAFPDLPLVAGTDGGDLYMRLVNGQPSGPKIHICDGIVNDLVTHGQQVLAECSHSSGGEQTWYLYDLTNETTQVVTEHATGSAVFTPDGRGVVYGELGRSEPAAPISMTKLMLRDLATGTLTQIDERYGVANALRLTGEGVTVWRAKNNPAFVRSDAEAGTWILRGTTLVRYSQNQLIASSPGLAVLETESQQLNMDCCPVVLTKTTVEQRLTPSDVDNEHVVGLLDDGRILTWRPRTSEYEGELVVYEHGTPIRIDHGSFSTWRVMRSGDWVIAGKAYPDPALLAYRISDGRFASLPVAPGSFHAIAMLSAP